jgi:hypothetical protein
MLLMLQRILGHPPFLLPTLLTPPLSLSQLQNYQSMPEHSSPHESGMFP